MGFRTEIVVSSALAKASFVASTATLIPDFNEARIAEICAARPAYCSLALSAYSLPVSTAARKDVSSLVLSAAPELPLELLLSSLADMMRRKDFFCRLWFKRFAVK